MIKNDKQNDIYLMNNTKNDIKNIIKNKKTKIKLGNQEFTDVLIIGGGPVGIFAAFQATLLGLRVLLAEDSGQLGGMCNQYKEKYIYDIPGLPKILAKDLIDNLIKQMNTFQVKILLNCKVLSYKRIKQDITNNDTKKNNDNSNNINKSGQNEEFIVKTTLGDLNCKAIVLAIGNGIFQPNKPAISDLDKYTNRILFKVDHKKDFYNKDVMIVGGGDSALDWVLELSRIAKKIFLIHRRDKFSAMESSVQAALKIKNIIFYTCNQLSKIHDGFTAIDVKNVFEDKTTTLKVDYILCFLGTLSNIGTIRTWGLELQNNKIIVDRMTQQTCQKGIYAIGDGCTYPNKLKLILTGFAEAATAIHHIYPRIRNKKLNFTYSTHLFK